ncbi:hypothetical protein NPIL_624301 [Nephila pilipes]|uniref:Uncharacterized protein n=1 Tax=Nephila pilipes TaxID=299642 RepID=A0A8X6NPZ8_NEPPI|nr:hypothetical protein NPIL_624301 [Nephila pilipes]
MPRRAVMKKRRVGSSQQSETSNTDEPLETSYVYHISTPARTNVPRFSPQTSTKKSPKKSTPVKFIKRLPTKRIAVPISSFVKDSNGSIAKPEVASIKLPNMISTVLEEKFRKEPGVTWFASSHMRAVAMGGKEIKNLGIQLLAMRL